MAKSIEATGKSIEEAISSGLLKLSLTLSEVNVEVLDEGSKGLFGFLGGKDAKVRLTVKEEEESLAFTATPKDVKPPAAPVFSQPDKKPAPPRDVQAAKPASAQAPINTDAQPEKAAAALQSEEEADAALEVAVSFLTGLLEKMNSAATISATQQGETVVVSITGDPQGILIGHRGETLDAIQYLTNLQVNAAAKGYHKVQLDVENYRQRRADTLARLAEKTAGRVVRTGRKVALEPMNPYERHILHATLQDHPQVTTHSEGTDPNRHVVICPKQNTSA